MSSAFELDSRWEGVHNTINALDMIANGLGLTVFELFDRVREQLPHRRDGIPAPRTIASNFQQYFVYPRGVVFTL